MKKQTIIIFATMLAFVPQVVLGAGCKCTFTVVDEDSPCENASVDYVFSYGTPFVVYDVLQTIPPTESCTPEIIESDVADGFQQEVLTPDNTVGIQNAGTCGFDPDKLKYDGENDQEILTIVCETADAEPNYDKKDDSAPASVLAPDDKKVDYVELPNPMTGNYSIQQLLGLVVSRFMGILGSIVLVVFIYGGFMFLTAAGNDDKVKKGTNAMLYAAIGLFIIFGAYVILSMVLKQILVV